MEKPAMIEMVNRMSWDSCKMALVQIINLRWDECDLRRDEFMEILKESATWPGKEPAEE